MRQEFVGKNYFEFKRDFGNTEAEKMGEEFLAENFKSFTNVEHSSNFDDIKAGIDFVAVLKNGKQLAIQFTITDSLEKRIQKINKMIQYPLTYLHDNEGRQITRDKIPLVLIYEEKKKWAEAWRKGKVFEDIKTTKIKFLCQMIDGLNIILENNPGYKNYFEPVLQILKEEQKELTGV